MGGMFAHDEVAVTGCAAVGCEGYAEVGIVVGDGDEVLPHLDVVVHLFEELAAKGLLRCLTSFYLTARKLPMMTCVGESSFPLLHTQDFALMLYNCCNNNHIYNSSAS